ncbi:MGH1-like glycoside hydrolase domain-containing protein [Aporhodopirellula aestuarii]|uniref:Glucosidase n=1 Tax=Aporhodopirellula aestuarii TaxID=2950107 RepID=A0ABT0U1V5_9BACT|nr:glucosidase [Aporhodopirellula aestuarii]MCM2370874.1 glucosidase [Aporhodopirellula aestuarii]
MNQTTDEHQRLYQNGSQPHNWKRWGPYVAERSWGTVREDYSADGDAWNYVTHDDARSKAYRWGEDGLAGVCDRYQLLCFALALWNGRDPILKERLFGTIPAEGNHGEDVKEYYYYLDSTPTHSYMRYLYKYPHREFPYAKLVEEGRKRGKDQPEYELLDTGVFDDNAYFDVFVEYAKNSPEDLCIKIEVHNRGSVAESLHVLPHLWFRNTWGWGAERGKRPTIKLNQQNDKFSCLVADDTNAASLQNLMVPYELGVRFLYAEAGGKPLFTDNENNAEKLYGATAQNASPYVKDAFHRHVIDQEECINHQQFGTKAAIHYGPVSIPAGGSVVIRCRLTDTRQHDPFGDFDAIVQRRKEDADKFYESIHPPKATADEKLIQRQALAGMLWTKQIYLFDVDLWLRGDNPNVPPPPGRRKIRNGQWKHLNSMRILSMPDKWEYPWFAAWDLAFHCIPLALVDAEFAKEQLWLMLFEQFQHSSGQIPAYEWEFSDLNPPVHAWAVWRVYNMDRVRNGQADREFLERCFHKLLLNFTWWVNKVDTEGNNVFEGGFLGLDNITVFDRSRPCADGQLKQADGTGWMGMFCLNMMRIALELAKENQTYVGLATKFFEHYTYIGSAIKHMGGMDCKLWCDEDGLFYDVFIHPDGSHEPFKVRSLVSLIPLFAVERLEEKWLQSFDGFRENFEWFMRNRNNVTQHCVSTFAGNQGTVHLLSVVNDDQLKKILQRLWNPEDFRSVYGLRSLSKHHQQHPFSFSGQTVSYEPGETLSWLKGGNSNWRGPVWFPTTFLMIESLRKLATAYGDSLQIRTPEAPDEEVRLMDLAGGFANGMINLFVRNAEGRRPIFGNREKMQNDPHWRDYLLFHEYFNAETGEGLGATHQTGWTGLVASLIDEWRH